MKVAQLRLACLALAVTGLTACSTTSIQAVPEKDAAPVLNGALILDQPPAKDSPAQQADEASYQLGLSLRNTPRGKRAAEDADMHEFEPLLGRFSETTGVQITKENTPETYRLLEIAWPSIIQTMRPAKKAFGRDRPFIVHTEDRTCRPDLIDELFKPRSRGSYPSGHTMRAWTVALTLAAVMPDQANKILREGFDIGESRWICGPHWKSDVEAGRTLGASVYARLTGDPAFSTQMQRAKAEVNPPCLKAEACESKP